jgi:hypothetical protein
VAGRTVWPGRTDTVWRYAWVMLTTEEARRFESKYEVARNGCWLWQQPLDRDGYGSFYLRRRNRRAHRVGWFSAHGEIPAGMVIDHSCGNRSCVNPSHLRLQTKRQNALENSRSICAVNARKTHCAKGHPFDRVTPQGSRSCSICERAKHRRLRARWTAEDTLRV